MEPMPKGWREIANRVNAEVNALPYRSDPDRYGKAEFWERADKDGGDCEDYALAKLKRLLDEGFPLERLRLATCRVGWTDSQYQEGHAVLVIAAPDDNYALDNRFPSMMPVYALIANGYSLEGIQETGGSRKWVKWVHV